MSKSCDVYSFFNAIQEPFGMIVIDIRGNNEYVLSRIYNAINIPFDTWMNGDLNDSDVVKLIVNGIKRRCDIGHCVQIYVYGGHNVSEHVSKIFMDVIVKADKTARLNMVECGYEDIKDMYPFVCDDEVILKSDSENTLMEELIGYGNKKLKIYKRYPNSIINNRLYLGLFLL